MTPTFRYRGPKTFYFKRKEQFDSLRSMMAEHRTCYPGGGGSWSGKTGDGVAWHKDGDRFGPWMKKRKIVRGQWTGPWYRVNWRIEG